MVASISRRAEWSAVAAMLCGFALACLRFAWTTSATFDEPGLIYSGYANLSREAVKTHTGNVLLAPTWMALPLLAMKPAVPTAEEIAAVEPANRELGRMFLYHPKNEWAPLLRAARAMNIVLAVVLGVVVFRWSRALFGQWGGLLSLAFYCLSPVVLANAALATTDLATALGFTWAVERWWALLQDLRWRNVLACGLATGLLFLTKFSALALGPMVLGLVLVRLLRRDGLVGRWRGQAVSTASRGRAAGGVLVAVLAVAAVAVAVIWLGYWLPMTVFAGPGPAVPWEAVPQAGFLGGTIEALQRLHLLPEPYLRDFWWFNASAGGRRAYLMGEYAVGGWWYFFPVAWWLKTPLPFLVGLGLAVAGVVRARLAATVLPLAILVGVYGGISLFSGLNIGIRHWLPLFPALFIAAGALVTLPWRAKTLGAVAGVLVAGSLAEVAQTKGQYLAYMNVFGGGMAEGHRRLIDSSYEWGQDLPAVENWLAARKAADPQARPVYFSYFGNADLRRFDLEVTLLPQFFELRGVEDYELRAGTYLISATMLHSVYGMLFGPWRASHENVYRALLAERAQPAPGLSPEERAGRFRIFDALRFGRLCSYLRKREPDVRVTFGVLGYELSEQELRAALLLPTPEDASTYQVPGTEHLSQAQVEFLK